MGRQVLFQKLLALPYLGCGGFVDAPERALVRRAFSSRFALLDGPAGGVLPRYRLLSQLLHRLGRLLDVVCSDAADLLEGVGGGRTSDAVGGRSSPEKLQLDVLSVGPRLGREARPPDLLVGIGSRLAPDRVEFVVARLIG